MLSAEDSFSHLSHHILIAHSSSLNISLLLISLLLSNEILRGDETVNIFTVKTVKICTLLSTDNSRC